MNLFQCYATKNPCYKNNLKGRYKKSVPVGIMIHSTGANNPTLKRYVQPSSDSKEYKKQMSLLGKNKYMNSWNSILARKCCHAFIGKLASGEVATAQLLPWEYSCWGCGNGRKGSYNYYPHKHIQFEVCEDNLDDIFYFNKAVMKEAAELCAHLCKEFGFDASCIVSHREGHIKGYASNHGDIDYWLSRFGYTMEDFRARVQALLDKDGQFLYKKTTASLALRSLPATSKGKRYFYIPKGKEVKVICPNIAMSDGYVWDKIEYDGQEGYSACPYLEISSPSVYKKTTAPLALRSVPSTTSGSRFLYIPKGGFVRIICENYAIANGFRWDKAEYRGIVGFCASKYLK